jgi:hypothetical protein
MKEYEERGHQKGERMGIKRFLVVGGMVSLVLIGGVLFVDATSIADPVETATKKYKQGDKVVTQNTAVNPPNNPQQAYNQGKTLWSQRPGVNPPNNPPNNPPPPPGESVNAPPPQEEIAGMGMGNMGDQQAPSGDTGSGGTGGGTGGTDGGGGATVTMLSLPETGGLSVVLLLTSALLLGSGLLMVTVVRSIRS